MLPGSVEKGQKSGMWGHLSSEVQVRLVKWSIWLNIKHQRTHNNQLLLDAQGIVK